MVVEPPWITIHQIVLSFFSRSIIATQTNLSLILKKWYLQVGVWFPSNCHKTQPTDDFQEEMAMEPPSITIPQIVLSFVSSSIITTQTNLSLFLKKWCYMLEFDSLQSAIKLNPPMTFKKKWLWNLFRYCPPNCTTFLFRIHRSHSNQSSPYPQEMVFTCWSLIPFKLA